MIKFTVDAALGLPCSGLKMKPAQGYWSSYMIHSLDAGIFKELWLSDHVKPKIVEQDIWVKPGDRVEKYLGSNHTLGTMILKFNSISEMLEMIDNMEKDIKFVINENP